MYEIRKFGRCKTDKSRCYRVCKIGKTTCFTNKNISLAKAKNQMKAIQKFKKG